MSDRDKTQGPRQNAGTLHIVATPIGNADDISIRALRTLETADLVACEDTRVTSKLFSLHGIRTSLSPYHEHNAEKARPEIIRRLEDGENVALVSDAGTPMISDPGYKLVRDCIDRGIPVTTLPGASSVLAALVLSGLPTDKFFFAGFPPQKKGARRSFLEEAAAVPATLIFMESPRRLAASMADMAEILGDRDVSVSREITKLYEETRRGRLKELAAAYAGEEPPKGEAVIVIGPPEKGPGLSDDEIDSYLTEALAEKSLRDAVREVSEISGLPRKKIYDRALALGGEGESD